MWWGQRDVLHRRNTSTLGSNQLKRASSHRGRIINREWQPALFAVSWNWLLNDTARDGSMSQPAMEPLMMRHD
jgi:hypothetical protein